MNDEITAKPIDAGAPAPLQQGQTQQGQIQIGKSAAGKNPAGQHPAAEPPLAERRSDVGGAQYKRSIYALPVKVQVVIGTARPTVSELLQMKESTLLELDRKIDDPVDLCINDRVIARGELIETDPATGAIGIKLTEIVDISEDTLQ